MAVTKKPTRAELEDARVLSKRDRVRCGRCTTFSLREPSFRLHDHAQDHPNHAAEGARPPRGDEPAAPLPHAASRARHQAAFGRRPADRAFGWSLPDLRDAGSGEQVALSRGTARSSGSWRLNRGSLTRAIMIETLADSCGIRAFGFTLLHFIWQGAIIGLATAAVLSLLRRKAATIPVWRGLRGHDSDDHGGARDVDLRDASATCDECAVSSAASTPVARAGRGVFQASAKQARRSISVTEVAPGVVLVWLTGGCSSSRCGWPAFRWRSAGFDAVRRSRFPRLAGARGGNCPADLASRNNPARRSPPPSTSPLSSAGCGPWLSSQPALLRAFSLSIEAILARTGAHPPPRLSREHRPTRGGGAALLPPGGLVVIAAHHPRA